MKIYTKTGDKGETGLNGGKRVPKSHPRVEAYGDVDELNCAVGLARASLSKELSATAEALGRVQDECFVIGAILATPADKKADMSLAPDAVKRLEAEIDAWDADLAALKAFILPGGNFGAAQLHMARAVARRAERRVVELSAKEPVPAEAVAYLNRLSDWLFTAARWVNWKMNCGETKWAGLKK